MITLHLRYSQGLGWYVIEADPSRTFTATGTHERCLAGPFTTITQAADAREQYAAAFDQEGATA